MNAADTTLQQDDCLLRPGNTNCGATIPVTIVTTGGSMPMRVPSNIRFRPLLSLSADDELLKFLYTVTSEVSR